jgi:hypothetical protein
LPPCSESRPYALQVNENLVGQRSVPFGSARSFELFVSSNVSSSTQLEASLLQSDPRTLGSCRTLWYSYVVYWTYPGNSGALGVDLAF